MPQVEDAIDLLRAAGREEEAQLVLALSEELKAYRAAVVSTKQPEAGQALVLLRAAEGIDRLAQISGNATLNVAEVTRLLRSLAHELVE